MILTVDDLLKGNINFDRFNKALIATNNCSMQCMFRPNLVFQVATPKSI